MALAAGLDGKRTLANQLEITSTAFRLDKTLSGCNYSQMLLFALTSLMSVPLQTNGRKPDVRAIFSVDDFPTYLAQEGVSRIVHVRVTVRPDGVLQSCSAEVSSGDGKLDAYTCQLIVRRAKFVPARWPDGTAAYGVIRVPVNWLVANGPLPDDAVLKATTPDVELSVNQLPRGAHSIVGLSLEVAADETGHAVSCAENPSVAGPSSKQHFPELVPLACQQVMSTYKLVPPTDGSGKPVRSIQTVSVHFELDH